MLRWISASLISALLTLAIFFLMYKMIEPDETSIIDTTAYKLVEFIHVQKQEKELQRRKVLPPPPKEKKEPPRVKKSVETKLTKSVAKHENLLNMQLPSIQTSALNLGAMPKIGAPLAPSGDGELSAMVQINPLYPPRAKRMGIEGYVKVLISVDAEGEVEDIKILESMPEGVFDKAVKRALRRWQFKPKVLNGVAVAQEGEMRLNFKLDK